MFAEEEHEVTLSLHQEVLEGGGKHVPKPVDLDDVLLEEQRTTETDSTGEASTEEEPVNRASSGLEKQSSGYLRRKISRMFICGIIVFAIGVGIGIVALWQLGAGNPFVRSEAGEKASAEEAAEQDPPTTAPSLTPSTSEAPSTPLPSLTPSVRPSVSRFPSVSSVPTTATPSMMPSITPRPSGSVLPSHLPSTSMLPTAPSSSPSFSSDVPSVAPTSSPTRTPTTNPSHARVCNGLASNCHRRADEIMYASIHNAMSSQEDGFLGFNNLRSMEDAMYYGFRGFLLDSCDCGDDGVLFCHSLCVAGTREPRPIFESIVAFLQRNEWDIIVLELQVTDNSLWGLWDQTTPEFRDLVYRHPADITQPWPTLNEMIDMGKRVLVFQHNGGNCKLDEECPEGVMDMFNQGFQTTWEISGADELMNFNLSCEPKTGLTTNPFMLLNHFANNRIGLPSRGIAEEVNTAEALRARIDACSYIVGQRPNILAVDFWSIGDTVQVVNEYNAKLTDEDNVFLVGEE